MVTLKVRPEVSSRGNEFQHYLLYYLVLLLSIVEDAVGEIDGKLVFHVFLYEG